MVSIIDEHVEFGPNAKETEMALRFELDLIHTFTFTHEEFIQLNICNFEATLLFESILGCLF